MPHLPQIFPHPLPFYIQHSTSLWLFCLRIDCRTILSVDSSGRVGVNAREWTTMAGEARDATHYHRQACNECQRRKQKCSREWPCNHCLKRKVADKCTFSTWGGSNESAPAISVSINVPAKVSEPRASVSLDEDHESTLGTLGYMTNELLNNLGLDTKPDPGEFLADADSCPQLDLALALLPSKPHLGSFSSFRSNESHG
jgi:hypothetical protein